MQFLYVICAYFVHSNPLLEPCRIREKTWMYLNANLLHDPCARRHGKWLLLRRRANCESKWKLARPPGNQNSKWIMKMFLTKDKQSAGQRPATVPAQPQRCRDLPRLLNSVIAFSLLAVAFPLTTQAAGLLIADGGFGGVLEVKEHSVQVTINNGIAVTKITQVFHNTEKRQVEALYTFPVPKGASVANFSMWINGKEMVGEVLEKQRAREIYNSYKQMRRDPGLLEQTDYRTFEMRIFPIGPEADQKVEITYYQELDFDHDTATYVYPLATVTRKGVDSRVSGRVALSLDLKS